MHRGQAGALEVVALLTTIGMDAARRAARQMLAHGVDHVMVVGIAGSVDPGLRVGDVVAPEVVVDRATRNEYRPSRHGRAPRGVLSCGDDLITDRARLAAMAAAGVVAVDMETAAVGAVCDDAGCPWAVFRAISDVAGEGPIDDELFALTRPDGSADPDAVARYFDEHPERRDALVQLARDATLATEAAAGAAIRACASLVAAVER